MHRGNLIVEDAGDGELDFAIRYLEWHILAGTKQFHARHFLSRRKSHCYALLTDGIVLANPTFERVGICVVEDVDGISGLSLPREGFNQTFPFNRDWRLSLRDPLNGISEELAVASSVPRSPRSCCKVSATTG